MSGFHLVGTDCQTGSRLDAAFEAFDARLVFSLSLISWRPVEEASIPAGDLVGNIHMEMATFPLTGGEAFGGLYALRCTSRSKTKKLAPLRIVAVALTLAFLGPAWHIRWRTCPGPQLERAIRTSGGCLLRFDKAPTY